MCFTHIASHQTPNQKSTFFAAGAESSFSLLHHGPNNVSRWMTWLPISLKNAAKCDKWYQLQNHSITESLNANGAWEKLFTSHPRACRISVSNKKTQSSFSFLVKGEPGFFPIEPISGRNAVIRIWSDLVLLSSARSSTNLEKNNQCVFTDPL